MSIVIVEYRGSQVRLTVDKSTMSVFDPLATSKSVTFDPDFVE